MRGNPTYKSDSCKRRHHAECDGFVQRAAAVAKIRGSGPGKAAGGDRDLGSRYTTDFPASFRSHHSLTKHQR